MNISSDFDINRYLVKPTKKEICFEKEDHYKIELETKFFPTFFDGDWKPIKGETKEKNIRCDTNRSRIDYFGFRSGIPTYVEVKNDRIRQRYLLQIVRYYCECNEEHHRKGFSLYVICSKKIRPHREAILKKLDIHLLDIEETINNGGSS